MKGYAEIKWTVADVLSLEVANGMTEEQAEQFLEENELRLRHRLCELGFQVIEDLLRERRMGKM